MGQVKGHTQMEELGEARAEAREVVSRYDRDEAWDGMKARDLDPRLIEYVGRELARGLEPHEILRALGLRTSRHGKQWKKIQAAFRQGFRADAELYIVQQSTKLFRAIERARGVLEDAFENGTPQVILHDESHEVIRVKGATKELAGFMKAYTEAISMPIKLWKEFGAIGEKSDTPKSLSIVVKNMIQFPSVEEIENHRDEVVAKANAIEVEKA